MGGILESSAIVVYNNNSFATLSTFEHQILRECACCPLCGYELLDGMKKTSERRAVDLIIMPSVNNVQ